MASLSGKHIQDLVSTQYYRVPKCDVIKMFIFASKHFHDHISVGYDEKTPHIKFYMNRFMGTRDTAL